MNQRTHLFRFLMGMILWMPLASLSASAQSIVPVFPANGGTIGFQDLVIRGFEWTGPPDAVKYQIRLIGPDPFLSQVPFPAEESPLKIQSIMERYFPDGADFQWRIEQVAEDESVVATSDWASFKISNQTSLIPTPTPVVWPTPSGDLDGSARVDTHDLFILAAFWIKSDGSLRAADLNQDSTIDRNDLLIYRERFGKPGDPPPPAAPVGIPSNLRFSPGAQVTIAETPTLEIQWDVPAYPQSHGFVYDMLIIPPYGSNIEYKGIAALSLKPFQTMMTRTGIYTVYLQARLDNVGASDITSGQFEIVYYKAATPTPTTVVQTANISGDNRTNALDVASFLQAFNTYKGHVKFNTLADLHTDEKIDRQDLLLFQQYYKERNQNVTLLPKWLKAEIPVIEEPMLGVPEQYTSVDLLPPYELKLGESNPKNALAQALYLRLYFSPVDGAIDYFVSMYYQNRDVRMDFFTGGSTSFTEKLIPLGHDEIIQIEVQAAGEGLLLGNKSDTLRVIIPPY